MAGFSDKITVIIDVATEKAKSGLASFKQSVGEAEGFTGKLKAGVGSLASQFTAAATSPAGLAAGISTGALYAAKAVNDYADLGVEVGKFSDATGLATEDSSRWVEVAGDLGVSAESLQTTIGRLNKNIKPDLFKELGIQIAKTKDGTTDVNGTFLNVIDSLREMKDPTQRAAAATKLLGKGWQDISEVIGIGSAGLNARLQAVADVKVFNQDDVKKAREFRDMMDDLNDTVQEVSLRLGKNLLPAVKDLGNLLGDVSDLLDKLPDELLGSPLGGMADLVRGSDDLSVAVAKLASNQKAASFTTEDMNDALRMTKVTAHAATGEVSDLADKVDEVSVAYDALTGKLDERAAWRNVNQNIGDLMDGTGDLAAETDTLVQSMASLIVQMDGVPESVKTELIAKLDEGAITEVYKRLDDIERHKRYVDIVARFGGAGDFTDGAKGAAIVNNWNINTKADPNEVIAIIRKYERQNGRAVI